MKKRIQALFLVAILFITVTFNSVNVSAYSINNDIRVFYKSIISGEVSEYVEEYAEEYLLSLGIAEEYEILTPFIIFDVDDYIIQESIFCFPLAFDNQVEYVLSTFIVNNQISASISKFYAPILNTIDYYNWDNCILYNIYDNLVVTNQYNDQLILSEEYNEEIINSVFYNLDYEDKVDYIETHYIENEPTSAEETKLENTGFSIKNTYECRLNTTNRLVPQGDKGICWAASVATTVRYLKNRSDITATGVCDAIKHSYTGGTVDDKLKALAYYGCLEYGLANKQISFLDVSNNIRGQYPILASTYSSNGSGHSITIIGYSTHGGIYLIKFYNSATNSIESASYNPDGTRYSMDNVTYVWINTICAI